MKSIEKFCDFSCNCPYIFTEKKTTQKEIINFTFVNILMLATCWKSVSFTELTHTYTYLYILSVFPS